VVGNRQSKIGNWRSLVDDDLSGRLTWFFRLRWLAVAGVALTLVTARLALGIRFSAGPVLGVAAMVAGYNALFWSRMRRATPRAQQAGISAQIVLDLVALVLLLYFAGGVENPFSLYLVFHVAIAGIVLPGVESVLLTTLAVVLYSTMALLDHFGVVPHFPLVGLYRASPHHEAKYLAGVLFALGTTLFIVRYFTSRVSRRLSRRTGELAEANARLRAADRARLESVVMVTHELRSPMAAVYSLLGTVTDGYVERGAELPMLERARGRVKGLLKLTGDVLDLHKLELGEVRLEQKPLPLAPVLAAVVEQYSELAEQAGVSIKADVGAAAAIGDEQSVRFILSNLLANGIRYNRRGGSVSVTVVSADDGVEVMVADTGIGIPADDLPHVFDIFYRGEYARQTERLGAGLGLSLVKRLVESQGGRVRVRSEPGLGSEFAFTLRRAGPPARS
jgi:signal transduction histidine kinase